MNRAQTDSSGSRRRAMIRELAERFVSSLSEYSEGQLVALLRAQEAVLHASEQPEDERPAATVLLDPGVSKGDALVAIGQLADWLEYNWDEVQRQQASGAGPLAFPAARASSSEQPN